MARPIAPGSTSVSLLLFLQDTASTTGGGKTGLAYNTASLTCYYVRSGSAAVAISLVTQTVTGVWSSGGFVEVDATNMPGVYRFDVPNAVLAAGVRDAVIMLKGATGMAPLPIGIDLNAQVVLSPTQGAVTFGQIKILANAIGEGALHIVNSAVAGGIGTYNAAGLYGVHNLSNGASGVGMFNQSTGSNGYAQSNAASGASSSGQYNSGTGSDIQGNLSGSVASIASGGINSSALSSGALTAIADAVLKRDWTGLTGEASRSLLNAMRFLRNKWSISGSTLTVTQEDDSTPAWTATLSTDAGADPVTGSDPA